MSHIENRPVDQEISTPFGRRKTLFRAKRGTVAVMVALSALLLAKTAGLGIEASGWAMMAQGHDAARNVATYRRYGGGYMQQHIRDPGL